MKRHASIGIISLALSHLALASSSPVHAQAGSVGGSIGKQDKSISGGEDVDRPQVAPHSKPLVAKAQETPPCKKVVGTWAFSNGIGVVFRAGGDLSSTNSDVGRWTCKDGMVAAHWQKWTDHYVRRNSYVRKQRVAERCADRDEKLIVDLAARNSEGSDPPNRNVM